MNQLLTAKDYNTAGTLVKEYTYTYDTYGNIRTSSNGTTSHTYTYGDTETGLYHLLPLRRIGTT